MLPGAYLVLVALSGAYLGVRLVFFPINSELAGLPLLILSLPWSDGLASRLGAGGIAGWISLLGGIAANLLLLIALSYIVVRLTNYALAMRDPESR